MVLRFNRGLTLKNPFGNIGKYSESFNRLFFACRAASL
jgi:hypothetical protein